MAHSTINHAWMKPIKHTHFLHKAHHSFLALGDTRRHFRATLGAMLNGIVTKREKRKTHFTQGRFISMYDKIHYKKKNIIINKKKVVLNRLQKRHLFTQYANWIKKAGFWLVQPQLEKFYTSVNDMTKVPEYWFCITHKI